MIPATAFYLLRHGESEANLAGVAAGGGVDSLLTSKGEEQALDLANVIDSLKIKPSIIFSSPMKRARRTAEIVNTYLELPIVIVDNLEEHQVGDWEGRPWREIGDRFKAGETPPNGESYAQYTSRVLKALQPILNQTFERPPLIVAHGGTFRCIGQIYNREIKGAQNCHLHKFEPYADHQAFPWQVWEYNVGGIELRECRSGYCPLYKLS